jgi:hypothetical protein
MAQGTPKPPRRFVTVWSPNGFYFHDRYSVRGPETNFDLGSFSPLASVRNNMIALSRMASGGVGTSGNGHDEGAYASLTCCVLGRSGGPSIDQFIAQQLKQQNLFPAAKAPVFGVQSDVSPGGSPFFERDRVRVRVEVSPLSAFNSIFVGGAMTNQALASVLLQKRSILDIAHRDCVSHLGALTADGRQRLDAHCTVIRSLEKQLSMTSTTCGPTPQLDSERKAMASWSSGDIYNPNNSPRIFDFFSELIAAAFECDLLRVASINLGGGAAANFEMPWKVTRVTADRNGGFRGTGHHSYSHSPDYNDEALFTTGYAEMVARLVQRLDKAPIVGGSSILESSNVYWTSELGAYASGCCGHTTYDKCMFIFGRNGGSFKFGRHLEGNNENADTNALMVALIQNMGITGVKRFGAGGYDGPLARL